MPPPLCVPPRNTPKPIRGSEPIRCRATTWRTCPKSGVSVTNGLIFCSALLPWRKVKSPLNGGRGRDRTGGLVVANDALSQLSYTPTSSSKEFSRRRNSFQRRYATSRKKYLEKRRLGIAGLRPRNPRASTADRALLRRCVAPQSCAHFDTAPAPAESPLPLSPPGDRQPAAL